MSDGINREFNQDASRPGWLDDTFLETCVKHSRNLPECALVVLRKIAMSYAVPKGENFLSVIFRVAVSFLVAPAGEDASEEQEYYIIKSLILHGDLSLHNQLYRKEIDMYTLILPTVHRLLDEAGLTTDISCRCLHNVDGDNLLIALEDMKTKGFVVADRLKGLDLKHCKLVLTKLSRLHAASMCHFHNKEHLVDTSFFSSVFERPGNEKVMTSIEEMARVNCDLIINALADFDKYTEAIKFIRRYRDTLERVKMNGVLAYKQGNKFNAINHGDCWVNNIMFKYDQIGSAEEAIFIDFQESSYSSVANDFNMFFFTSANQEVRRNNFKELRLFYFESLVSDLCQLGYTDETPTFEEFKEETRRHVLMVMNVMTVFFPLVFMVLDEESQGRTATESLSLEDVEDLVRNQGQSSLFLETSKISVDIMIDEGYLDSALLPD